MVDILFHYSTSLCDAADQLVEGALEDFSANRRELLPAKVFLSDDSDIFESMQLKTLPEIRLVHRGEALPYHGMRKSDCLREWTHKRLTGNPLKYIATTAEMSETVSRHSLIVFGYFPSANNAYMETFRYLNRVMGDLWFTYSSEEDVGHSVGVDRDAVVIIQGERVGKFDINLGDSNQVARFIELERWPSWTKVSPSQRWI